MMKYANEEVDQKVYFTPGLIVELRLDIPNKPKMIVYRVERSIMRNKTGHDILKGVRTRWFTQDGRLQEAVWSTKDLILI